MRRSVLFLSALILPLCAQTKKIVVAGGDPELIKELQSASRKARISGPQGGGAGGGGHGPEKWVSRVGVGDGCDRRRSRRHPVHADTQKGRQARPDQRSAAAGGRSIHVGAAHADEQQDAGAAAI